MGREERDSKAGRLTVLKSLQGHESTVSHAFNHTGGMCPKCSCKQHVMMFCDPDQPNLPHIRGCELDGEHLHRICQACKYMWIERTMDQQILAEQHGVYTAESELVSCLAVIVERAAGTTIDYRLVESRRGYEIQVERDPEKGTITLRTGPPAPSRGAARNPSVSEVAEHLNNPPPVEVG